MRKGVCLEYLGDIDAETLLKNLSNRNELWSSIEVFREAFPGGFTVSAQIEYSIFETPEEKKTQTQFLQDRLRRGEGIDAPGRKLIGLVLSLK